MTDSIRFPPLLSFVLHRQNVKQTKVYQQKDLSPIHPSQITWLFAGGERRVCFLQNGPAEFASFHRRGNHLGHTSSKQRHTSSRDKTAPLKALEGIVSSNNMLLHVMQKRYAQRCGLVRSCSGCITQAALLPRVRLGSPKQRGTALTLHICAYAHMYACLPWLSTAVRGAFLLGADGLIWVCAPEAVLQTGDLMAGAYKKE